MRLPRYVSVTHSFYIIMLAWLMLPLPTFVAAVAPEVSGITELQSPYRQWYEEIADNPQVVIDKATQYLYTEERSPLEQAQIHYLLADSYGYLSLTAQAAAHVEQGMALLDAKQQPWLSHQFLLQKAQVLNDQGESQSALKVAQQVIRWASTNKLPSLLVDALIVRAMIEIYDQNYLLALSDLQNAQKLAAETDRPLVRGNMSSYLALVYQYRGEPVLALPYFEEAVKFNRSQENDMELSLALYGAGQSLAQLGNKARARGMLLESRRVAQKIEDKQGVAYADLELAKLDIADQRWAIALERLSSARETFMQGHNDGKIIDALMVETGLWIGQQQWDQARQALKEAEGMLNAGKMPRKANELAFQKAKLLAAEGRYRQAYETYKLAAEKRQQALKQESSSQLHEIRARYELHAHESENRLLAQRNQLQAALLENQAKENRIQRLLLLLASAIIVFLLYARYRARQHRDKLQQLASHDSLTGLLNRRHILRQAEKVLHAGDGEPHALALVDFDDFKAVNDHYGHVVGDKVLQEFGAICRQVLAGNGWGGRVGGEEFLLVLPHSELAQARHMLDELSRLSQHIPQKMQCPDIRVRLSAGLMQMNPAKPLTEHLDAVDKALYRAKRAGKNRIEIA